MTDDRDQSARALGALIRAQREAARLSLRQLAELTNVSNPYLSQIERGLHEPSVRVLRAIANALDLSAETLLTHAGLLEPEVAQSRVEEAIAGDPRLSAEQRRALIAVYRSYIEGSSGP